MTRIPDPIELGEAAVDRMMSEDPRGVMCGGCGNLILWDEGMHALSENPYSAPGCDDCLEKLLDGTK